MHRKFTLATGLFAAMITVTPLAVSAAAMPPTMSATLADHSLSAQRERDANNHSTRACRKLSGWLNPSPQMSSFAIHTAGASSRIVRRQRNWRLRTCSAPIQHGAVILHSSLGYKPPAPEVVAWPASPAVEGARPKNSVSLVVRIFQKKAVGLGFCIW